MFPSFSAISQQIQSIYRDGRHICYQGYREAGAAVQNTHQLLIRASRSNITRGAVRAASHLFPNASFALTVGRGLHRAIHYANQNKQNNGHRELIRQNYGRPLSASPESTRQLGDFLEIGVRAFINPANFSFSPFGTEHFRDFLDNIEAQELEKQSNLELIENQESSANPSPNGPGRPANRQNPNLEVFHRVSAREALGEEAGAAFEAAVRNINQKFALNQN